MNSNQNNQNITVHLKWNPTKLKSIPFRTIVKPKAFPLLKILWFSLMASLVFSSSFVSATQQRKNNPKIRVKNLTFKIDEECEKVIIDLDRVAIPIIFDIDGNNPRVVIDIMNVFPCRGRYRTPVNGKLIKHIRTYYHKDSEKLRVVLDMNPDLDYIISQFRISQKILLEIKQYESD